MKTPKQIMALTRPAKARKTRRKNPSTPAWVKALSPYASKRSR